MLLSLNDVVSKGEQDVFRAYNHLKNECCLIFRCYYCICSERLQMVSDKNI